MRPVEAVLEHGNGIDRDGLGAAVGRALANGVLGLVEPIEERG